MDITKIIQYLPASVKQDVMDFATVKLKDGRIAERVTLDRILTESEKEEMRNKHILGVDCIASYKSAPEIKKSYFYVL